MKNDTAYISAYLPASWDIASLGSIAGIEMGQSPPSSSYNETRDGLPFFQGKAEFGELYPVTKIWCNKPKKIASSHSILMSIRAPVGPTNLSFERCAIGRGLTAITPKVGINTKYLLYAVRCFVDTLIKQGTGTTFSAVNGQQVSCFAIPVAPTEEQVRIVDKLDELFTDLSAGIAALERVKRNLSRYRAAVLHAAVTGRLTEAWRKEHGPASEPGPKFLERILAERRRQWEQRTLAKYEKDGKQPPKNWCSRYSVPALPKQTEGELPLPFLSTGWCWASLDQVGFLQRGRSRHRPRDAVHLYGGPYPFIQTGDVRKAGLYIRDHTQTYSESGLAQSQLWPAGTLCITIAANIAETAILQYEACFPDSIVGYHGVTPLVLTKYVMFFIKSIQNRLDGYAPATAQKNINDEILKQVPIPIPPPEEQVVIVDAIQEKFSQIDALEVEIEWDLLRASRLRQAILKAAFEGKLVPQDPNDEPTSVMLERIRCQVAAPISKRSRAPRKRSPRKGVAI
jgi:type I restriction enzyme S subunit